jgi:hypothetical protein
MSPTFREEVPNPRRTLVVALNTFFSACRLVVATRKQTLDPQILSTEFRLVNAEDPDGAGFQISPSKDPAPPEHKIENVMLAVAASVFLQFDEIANQEVKPHKGGRFSHPDEDVRNALSILHLVRCAFAHNPLVPTWAIPKAFPKQSICRKVDRAHSGHSRIERSSWRSCAPGGLGRGHETPRLLSAGHSA